MKDFKKEYYLKQVTDSENPYYFEGIASSYGNVDCYGDIFLDGSLDDELGKTIPILVNHKWDITDAIGYGTLEKNGKDIIIKGEFLKGDKEAEKIVALKNSGVTFCLSIGGRVIDSKVVTEKSRSYRGIEKAEILETSVVLKGANPKAKITKTEEIINEEIHKINEIIERINKIFK